MKLKITALSLVAGMVGISAYGQGFLVLSSGQNTIYDGFTTAGTSVVGGTEEGYALYWAPNNTANPFASLAAITPTTGNSTTTASWTTTQAWSTLSSASSWTLGVDSQTYGPVDGSGTIPVVDKASANGVLAFYSQSIGPAGLGFGLDGTSAANYALLVVGFNGAYSDPTAAANAHSAIGWSYLSSFALKGSATDPNIGTPNFSSFGVFTPAAAPEPGTMALAALGGASLLLFRRRK